MKANPTAIGLFILGGLALVFAAVVAIAGGQLFQTHMMAVAYFPDSVQGLTVGSRVEFRGVPVGRVSAIKLLIDTQDLKPSIPVFMELNPEDWHYIGTPRGREVSIQQAVAIGLRAQLALESFVTGQMVVELDLRPDTPATMVRPNATDVPQIPTIKSDISRLKDVLTGLPLRELTTSLQVAVADLDRLLAAPELPDLLTNLAKAAANTDTLVAGLNGDRTKLMAQLHTTLDAFDKTATDLQALSGDARKTVKNLNQVTTTELRQDLKTAQASLEQMQRAFTQVAKVLSPYSPERTQISRILDTTLTAMQAVRDFAGELSRRPSALIFGK